MVEALRFEPRMTTEASRFQTGVSPRLLDYSQVLGAFLVLSPKGQLFALNEFLLSRDFTKLVPRISSANFHVLHPLLTSVTASRILLVIHPSDGANAYFLMDTLGGPVQRTIKVSQEPVQIVADALANDLYPVVHLGELQKRVLVSRANRAPLTLRIHYLRLRPCLPTKWRAVVRSLFLANAKVAGDKTSMLEEKLQTLRAAIQTHMVDDYLSKCIWLDSRTNTLGRLAKGQHNRFWVAVEGDPHVKAFRRSLALRSDGRYDFWEGVANVLPNLVRGYPWSSPTLHVYDEFFREMYGMQTHYSLYKGLQALSVAGAPVLVHGQGEPGSAIPVRLLRPSMARDQITQTTVRKFPAREIVWERSAF